MIISSPSSILHTPSLQITILFPSFEMSSEFSDVLKVNQWVMVNSEIQT